MLSISEFSDQLNSYLEPDQINQVKYAYYYAEQAHDGQFRQSGDPYITHPLAVAKILSEMQMDHQSLMAALLHDVIEDSGISKSALSKQFNPTVADLVDGVSKLTHLEFETIAEAQAENFQKMALAMAEDIRVILIKLGDRLHNMRTLNALNTEKRRRIARETLDLYAPIANRLGMNNVRIELEELGFKALHPMRAERIMRAVKKARGNRKEIVSQIQTALSDYLEQEGLPGRVIGREKHLHGIYQKMRTRGKSFNDIMDVYAFRIITDTVDNCYRILGAVHNLYKPVEGRFKDYIAIPKGNGYQSLHTTLFGMHGVPIEIQIRTREMEEMGNNGIAAHWLYKSNGDTDHSHVRARQWVKDLLEMQQRAGNSLEFIENVKTELFPHEVYVFTPKGKILEVPLGATPVDFAYAVHTDIGNTCVACRINRRLAPLSTPLQSGQTVEIITAPSARPNLAWLNFVITGKARSGIRHFLKHQKHSEAIALGKRLLSKALLDMNVTLEELTEEQIGKILTGPGASSMQDIYADIGLGDRMAYAIARLLADTQQNKPSTRKPSSNFTIQGTEGMVVSFAKCCHPIPGDPIIGHLSIGKGMVIHRETCRNIKEFRNNPEKCVLVNWDDQVVGEFSVALRIEVMNQRGIVASIATLVTDADANIEKISIEEKDAKLSLLHMEIYIKDRLHLARVMRRIRNNSAVNRISRARN
ncbi:MAG: bifunctional GTP diphosphokinase/guanosine-3',5'-bis pyrophosphate 3'-pyrophosphohydrolase [Pseudomonadales bacterium]|nr:bifunctional GTP diphosphokinase/guanosine-3',5'-bis pyrophosphate 3'-pyrophosphohydrolase [Pseudomonadales bacterium]